ncbi:Sporulation protein YqfD, partial [Dysosmobacter welbionis]
MGCLFRNGDTHLIRPAGDAHVVPHHRHLRGDSVGAHGGAEVRQIHRHQNVVRGNGPHIPAGAEDGHGQLLCQQVYGPVLRRVLQNEVGGRHRGALHILEGDAQRGACDAAEILASLRDGNGIAVIGGAAQLRQIEIVQNDAVHAVQHICRAGHQDGGRLDPPVHVVHAGAGGLHEVHGQLQLPGDIYRQRHLNGLLCGLEAGVLQQLVVCVIELDGQLSRDRGGGVLSQIQGHLGIADGIHILLIAPDLDLRGADLQLSGGVTLCHIAGDLAPDIHRLVVQLRHVDGDDGGRPVAHRNILPEILFRIAVNHRGHRLHPCPAHVGEIHCHPDIVFVQQSQVKRGPFHLQIHGADGILVQQHEAPLCKDRLPSVGDGHIPEPLGMHHRTAVVSEVVHEDPHHDG